MKGEKIKPLKFSRFFMVGNHDLDAQHESLFNLLNELIDCQSMSDDFVLEKIKDRLSTLKAEALSHFAAEEEIMTMSNYPFILEHREKHDFLAKEITVLQIKAETEPQFDTREMLVFLKHWLMQHLLTEDKKYVDHFFKNKN